MRSIEKGLGLLLLAGVLGCDPPAERLIKEQVQITNDLADRIESGKYDAIYGQSIQSRTMTNLYKQEKLKIPPEERRRLEDKYRPEMERATARLNSAWQKMTGKPLSPDPDAPIGTPPPTASEAAKPVDKGKEPEKSKPER